MNYEPLDRLPIIAIEPYEQSVIQRWRREGLSPDESPESFFGLDRFDFVPINFSPIPGFDCRVISEDDQYVVQLDWLGSTVRRRKEAPSMYYGHIDHPIKTRRDWESYRERFVPNLAERLPTDWGTETIRRLNQSDNPVGLFPFPFFFRLGFYAMGMERFLTAFYEEPDLIHDIFSFWADFVCRLIEPVLQDVKVDFLLLAEDLAYKTSTHISPRIYAEFWHPHQDPVIQLARRYGVPLIVMWTSGNHEPLLNDMIEHGFNCTWPLERQAGLDARQLRKRYGRCLRLGGNIAKEAAIAGPAAIDREIERLAPVIHDGGFLPALDDMVPEEVPFSHYKHLIDRLRALEV